MNYCKLHRIMYILLYTDVRHGGHTQYPHLQCIVLGDQSPCGFRGLEQTHSVSWPNVVKGD